MTDLSRYRDVFARVAGQTYGDALGLPGALYTDPAVTEVERRRLFHEDWICIGRAEEIPDKGDYFAFDLCGEPLIAVHGRDGVKRALANVCRHRGAKLVAGSGNARAFLCPYHHWGYDTTGKLTAAPGIDERPGFDPAACRLPEPAFAGPPSGTPIRLTRTSAPRNTASRWMERILRTSLR